jgi:O-antigen/teichoic acid export membrane protein
MMIGNLLYAIPWATTRSLFAEGSHDESELRTHALRAIKIIAATMLPAIAILLLFGSFLLHVFGPTYASEGAGLLRLIALSGIVVATYSFFGSYFKVRRSPKWLVVINLFYAIGIIGGTSLLIPLGLIGVGYAWIIGHVIAIGIGLAAVYLSPSREIARA